MSEKKADTPLSEAVTVAFDDLMKRISSSLNSWISEHGSVSETELMALCYEILAYHLGYTSAYLESAGISTEDQIPLFKRSHSAGKAGAINGIALVNSVPPTGGLVN